ncbi:hypothetical protein SAMN06298212_1298 [Ruaniaceae bacterium KH17]|nr:hypothetical protein SAMN06298212_1298 [Ruaniaceae bacterium KH17]
MKDEYPEVKQDLYGAFILRGIELSDRAGLLAIVVGDAWMSLKSFEALRRKLLDGHSFESLLHLRDTAYHADTFGANAAFVLSMNGDRSRLAPFVRLTPLGSEQKDQDLRVALVERTERTGFFLAAGEDFEAIPGVPIVYWLSEKMRTAFTSGKRLGSTAALAVGLQTGDNNRFLRQWWEVAATRTKFSCTSREEAATSRARWFPYNKGGEFRKWYGNQEHVVNWEHDGAEIVAFKPRSVIRNPGTYFSPSVSWSKISSGSPAFRSYPPGFIYDVAGTSIFAADGRARLGILSFANSQIAFEQLAAIAPTLNFEVGQVSGLPIADSIAEQGATLAAQAVETAREDWNTAETSWDFERNPLVEIASL